MRVKIEVWRYGEYIADREIGSAGMGHDGASVIALIFGIPALPARLLAAAGAGRSEKERRPTGGNGPLRRCRWNFGRRLDEIIGHTCPFPRNTGRFVPLGRQFDDVVFAWSGDEVQPQAWRPNSEMPTIG